MKLQYLCHMPTMFIIMGLAVTGIAAEPARGESPVHDYPTLARVEYVNQCVEKNGNKLAALYQCSCAIDKIAVTLSYDDFVEQSTFSKYATLPGEGGGIFRDFDQAKEKTKSFRALENTALQACGVAH